MIFLTVGTTDFDALVGAMDRLAAGLGEPVVAQTGRGRYLPRSMEHFAFAPSLDPYYAQARVVVAHGGAGTLTEVLRRGIPLIGVSNPDRYDQHQEDLLRAFSDRGNLLWCRDLNELGAAIRDIGGMRFTPYEKPPACRIGSVIRRYLGLTGEDAGANAAGVGQGVVSVESQDSGTSLSA